MGPLVGFPNTARILSSELSSAPFSTQHALLNWIAQALSTHPRFALLNPVQPSDLKAATTKFSRPGAQPRLLRSQVPPSKAHVLPLLGAHLWG